MSKSLQRIISLVFILFVFSFPAAQAAEINYLFEKNQAQFKDMGKVGSRSFKYLAGFDNGKTTKEVIVALRDAVKKAASGHGYAFEERKKGEEWVYSDKRYYDTSERALFKKGYVIRENYKFPEGEKPDPEKFVLTVKEMSPNDFLRLANSKLRPVSGSDSVVKFEENISLDARGELQSYFESAIGATVTNAELGKRALGDYGKLYPELLNLGLPTSTKLAPVVGHSVQLKLGSFLLPDGRKISMDIEAWSASPGGKPIVAEVAFDDDGYSATPEQMKAAEDFFLKVFGQALKAEIMPDSGPYMGSKVRVLFDQKHG